MHICELTWDLIQAGAEVRQGEERPPHRHLPRLLQRGAGLAHGRLCRAASSTIPRDIIRAVANHYHDMAPGTTHEATFCCGGGGGLLTDDLLELRVKGALPRMEALKQVVDEHGVNFMATICAICKAQFTKVLPYYGFKMGMVGGVHQLVSTAIVLGNRQARRTSTGDTPWPTS
jgi:hypothetical protein